ncbi:amidohydrolase family protein [Candidatus Peregrinibacteria bacterium]|nr:amidohydrolase family protein [Candidatus Peregrinibacteria bacterium]
MACCVGFYSTSIIDTHEHIESIKKIPILLKADDEHKISTTILLPTPTETLTLNGDKSFTNYRENTDEIFKIVEAYPRRFIPFCTVNPLESDALQYVKHCIERGGKGLKLYNGHSYYYDIFDIPLDSPRMAPIYAFAEKNKIPVLYHINITKYIDELERVLQNYPELVVSVPHYMVSSINLDQVAYLLDKYPNLYTDVSFGSLEYMAAGFRRISKNPKKYEDFINTYSSRILFGTDMVLSDSEAKNFAFMNNTIECYKSLLEKRNFECDLVASYYKDRLNENELCYSQCKPIEGEFCKSLKKKIDVNKKRYLEVIELNGLHLHPVVLEQIYKNNPLRFLNANS